MAEIKKTDVEIIALKISIESELERLPDENAFGECNLGMKEEMQEQIDSLDDASKGITPVDNEEVQHWLEGGTSDLNDYLF